MRKPVQIATGLLLLLAGGVVAWWLLSAVAQYVLGLDKALAPAVIGGFVTVALAIFAFWRDRAKSRAEAHRENKIEVYSIFYDIIFKLLEMQKSDESYNIENDPEFQKKWFQMTRGVLFYGSPEVVDAFSKFKVSDGSAGDPLAAMRNIGRILLAMRKDIGLSNWGLNELSIHQIYVNDDVRKIGKG
ncbi:hypothetical protein [Mesorhizobium australicum]|uniref:hypothetical protein n=1 Tax=Mesorhizobium australicum TaxID=536018 RepID=UPI00111C9365|nr:hypothetical protein [Mesorhizobium australicum]